MVRPTDYKIITIEKIVCYSHRSQRKGARQAIQGYMRKHRGWSGGGTGKEENLGQESLLWFPQEGIDDQGKFRIA